MNEAAAGEYALPLGTVVQCCLDTEMLQWLFVFLTLPLLIGTQASFVLCLVPGVAGCISISMTCFVEFLFLTTSFKILKW